MDTNNFTLTLAQYSQCYSNELVTYLENPVYGYVKVNNILLAAVNLTLVICGTFSNIFVILTYCLAGDPSVKRLSNMLVMALACSDLLVTALIQPIFALRKGYYEIYGLKNCILYGILRLGIHVTCGVSGMIIIIVIAERYVAITRPYLYPEIITRFRLKVLVFIIWITWFFIVCSRLWFLSAFGLNTISSIAVIVFLFSTTSMWIHIFVLANGHKKSINRQLSATQTILNLNKDTYSIACIILLCITVCYTPVLVMLTYGSLYGMDFKFLYVILPWAETLVFFNSFANSAIFTWREKKFRDAFYKMMKFKQAAVAPTAILTRTH